MVPLSVTLPEARSLAPVHPVEEVCAPAPLWATVRPSQAAVLAGVSKKTIYAWLARGLLVDYAGPGHVAAIRLDELAALVRPGDRPYSWPDVCHAIAVAARKEGEAQRRRRRR